MKVKLKVGDRLYGKRDGEGRMRWYRGGDPVALRADAAGSVTAIDPESETFDVGDVEPFTAPPVSNNANKVPRWARRKKSK